MGRDLGSRIRGLRPTPPVAIAILVLAPLAVIFTLPLQTGPVEIATQGGTRSLRNPRTAVVIAPPTTVQIEEEAAEPIPILSVDPRTFLTAYEDSVVLQNLPSLCDAPPPPDAIHVATDGDDGGSGTADQPLATLNRAVDLVQPGQTVLVRGGEYRQTVTFAEKYGTPDAYITLRAHPGEQVTLIADVGEDTIRFRRGNAYINVACFEMAGPGQRPEAAPSSPEEMRSRILSGQAGPDRTPQNYGAGVDIGDRADTRAGYPLNHHIRIIGNDIHDYAEAGVSALETNHVTIIGNRTYRNAKYGCHSGSGISLAYLVDGGGPDNNDGYSNYVVGNVSYENENISLQCFSDSIGPLITDGNGIIVDQNDLSGAYTARTLIADNVVYDNGGRGIMVFESSRVDVVNNLSFNNVLTPNLVGREGPHPEIAVSDASDVRVYNNIAVPRAGHVAYSDRGAEVDERTNLFTEPGGERELFDPSVLDEERRFSLLPAAEELLASGTPYLATPSEDGAPILVEPVLIGPIYNSG
ncbi:MAG: right-handed parallel beta-helix repeat-containing protein [Actinomycetota bacterium]